MWRWTLLGLLYDPIWFATPPLWTLAVCDLPIQSNGLYCLGPLVTAQVVIQLPDRPSGLWSLALLSFYVAFVDFIVAVADQTVSVSFSVPFKSPLAGSLEVSKDS